jgi:hypothetical protein
MDHFSRFPPRKQHPELSAVQETARLREICGLTTPDAVNFTRRELIVLIMGCMMWLRTQTHDPHEKELCEDWQLCTEWVADAMGEEWCQGCTYGFVLTGYHEPVARRLWSRWISDRPCPAGPFDFFGGGA